MVTGKTLCLWLTTITRLLSTATRAAFSLDTFVHPFVFLAVSDTCLQASAAVGALIAGRLGDMVGGLGQA